MSELLKLFISSIVAGVLGTLLGAVLAVFFGKKSDKITSLIMCFAGGVMLSIVCFDLIPETIAISAEVFGQSNIFAQLVTVVASIGIGVLFVLLLSNIVKLRYSNIELKKNNTKQLTKEEERKFRMIKMGIIMTLAIGLHNFPEGLAIGASQSIASNKGLLMAILIAIHNIPEGIAMVAPLKEGGMKNSKVLIIATVTGVPTVIGAMLGYLVGNTHLMLNAACVGIAGGSMLYIIFSEMLREAFDLDRSKTPAIVTVASIVLGLILIKIVM